MIVSRQNQRLKDIRRLRRCKGDRAVLEGAHLVGEANALGLELETVLVTPRFAASSEGQGLRSTLADAPLEVAEALLDELCDADSPRGVLAVARLPRRGVEDLPRSEPGLYGFVDGLQDPGNLGALARSFEAAGATGLALSPGSVHPNHPRALRASAGSLLRLPVAIGAAIDEVDDRLAGLQARWVALAPRRGQNLWEAPLDGSLVLAVGSEGAGLSDVVERRAEIRISVPMQAPVESLNTTVAASLVLYEIARRQRAPQG